jgi:transglutaminase-like putative cysteine protease
VSNVGIDKTLRCLTELAETGAKDPRVRRWVLDALFHAVALTTDIERTTDALAVEWTASPILTLRGEAADADDIATALAAVLTVAGFEVRIVAHAFNAEGAPAYQHAVCEVKTPEGWINADAWAGIKLGQVAKRPTELAYGPSVKRRSTP